MPKKKPSVSREKQFAALTPFRHPAAANSSAAHRAVRAQHAADQHAHPETSHDERVPDQAVAEESTKYIVLFVVALGLLLLKRGKDGPDFDFELPDSFLGSGSL